MKYVVYREYGEYSEYTVEILSVENTQARAREICSWLNAKDDRHREEASRWRRARDTHQEKTLKAVQAQVAEELTRGVDDHAAARPLKGWRMKRVGTGRPFAITREAALMAEEMAKWDRENPRPREPHAGFDRFGYEAVDEMGAEQLLELASSR